MTSPAPPAVRRRLLGRFALAAAIFLLPILLLAIGAFLAVRAFLAGSGPARVAETVIAAAIGEETRFESLDVRPGDGVAAARGIAIGRALSARRARATFEPAGLASGEVPRLVSLEIDGASVVLSKETLPDLVRMAERLAGASRGAGGSGAPTAKNPEIRVTSASVRIEREGAVLVLEPVSFFLDSAGEARLDASGAGFAVEAATVPGGFRARVAFEKGPDGTFIPGFPAGAAPETLDAEIAALRSETERGGFRIDGVARARLARHPLTHEPAEVAVELAARAGPSGPVSIDRLAVAGLALSPIVASGDAAPDAARLSLRSESSVRFGLGGPAALGTLVLEEWSAEARAGGAVRFGVLARAEGLAGPLGAAADGASLRLDATFPGGFGADAAFTFDAAQGGVTEEPVRATGRGRFSLQRRALFVDAGRFDWPGVGSASIDGAFDASAGRLTRCRADVTREIDLEAAANALKRGLLLPAAVALGGRVRGGAEIEGWTMGEPAPDRASALVLGRDVRFSVAPKSGPPIDGEKLRFSASLAAERSGAGGTIEGRLAGDFGNVEILAGDRFFGFEGLTIGFDVPFSVDPAAREIRSAGAGLSGGDLGSLAAAGSIRLREDGTPEAAAVDLSLAGVALETAFERTLLADARERYPSLASTAIVGTLDATARASLGPDGAVALEGEVTVDGAGAAGPFFDVEGASCRVPLSLGATATGPRPGFLRIDAATVRGVRVEGLDLPLLFAPGRVLLLEPKSVSVFGGEIEVADLRYAAGTGAAASFVMRGLDAALIGHALDSPVALAGGVESEGPLVMTASESGIRFAGTVVARVLGGDVRIGGLGVDDPLGSVPRFRFDADAVDLDLEKLTAALAYGEMTGNFSGEARGVVVSPHGLERFAARFEARATEGRPAKASVKAIREIPFLATEGRLTLQGILFRAINSFSYSRFGGIAALEGDLFHVRGRYAEDGRDLYGAPEALLLPFRPSGVSPEHAFIGSGLFPRLDILVEPPAKPLSFQEFVRQVLNARKARLE